MKKNILLLSLILICGSLLNAQEKYKDREGDDEISKSTGIVDQAGGTHDASNIGLFFENRGKLYPRRVSQGPSGEFPINSTKHYIYRINPFVGVPNNVIQGRFTDDEEWLAVGGYHNPELSQIAFSDKPNTWHPVNGWPVKDDKGDLIFKSDQDSYCVYSDSNNSRQVLGIQVAQTGYTYGINFAKNIIFFKYDIVNKGSQDLSDLYFALYTDIDIGNVSGGDPEYGDDFIGFDKEENFLYFYDDGFSSEWPGGLTGYFGVALMKTPEINGQEPGITDMHYNLYDYDEDIDSVLYGIMSSSQSLYSSPLGSRYFHLGNNPNIHFDDPATIPPSGMDIVGTVSSGPYALNVGDTLTFYTAILAGETYEEIYNSLYAAKKVMQFDFEISKPPKTPILTGIAGDKKNVLYWDDAAESSFDKFSNEFDFEGYRLYRSIDKGINWIKLSDYNIQNSSGLQYNFTDSTVTNGFEYWYTN